jgi:hypothetical protein
MTAGVLEAPALPALPAARDAALAAAVDRVFQDKGLTFDSWPRYVSQVPGDTDISAAIKGAELMGLPLTPQGCVVAGVLEAKRQETDAFGTPLPWFDEVTIEMPRRATKTTVIQMTLLGRCASIDNYRVVSTAQDGTRASQFFMNMVRMIEARLYKLYGGEGLNERQLLAKIGVKQIYKSQGREYIEFLNGSRWWVVKPESSALRGEAADVMWFDEAGELNPDTSDDLMAGALPLMDTRDLGQVIISGTPGLVRAGMFWEYLEAGRQDAEANGIVDWCANEWDDPTDETAWWMNHPGVACGLTTVEKLRKRLDKMSAQQFAREYLCIWPTDRTVSALDKKKFQAGAVAPIAFEQLPAGVPWAAAFDCHMDGMSGSILAGWWEDGVPHMQVMEHRAGVDWMPAALAGLFKHHPDIDVVYDAIGQNQVVAQQLAGMVRVNTRKLRALPMREVSAAASMTAGAVDQGQLKHGESKSLTLAVEGANWRFSGENRFFGRKSAAVCISGIIAGSMALFTASGLKPVERRRSFKARTD